MANSVVNTTSFTAASANNIAQSQSPGAAGYLTLNGSTVSSGVATVATAGTERAIIITSGGNDSGRTFTVVGTNADGSQITSSVAGANIGVATLPAYFRTVSSVYIDGASAGTVTVGTTAVGASRPINVDTALNPINVTVSTVVTGTVNYTLQYTLSDFFGSNALVWNDDVVLAAQTASGVNSYAMPITGVRTLINSGTGSVVTTVQQSGLGS